MTPTASSTVGSVHAGRVLRFLMIGVWFAGPGAVVFGGCGDDDGAACSASTCPDGCCSGTDCQVPSPTACGVGGAQCVDCLADERADSCVDGACVCGAEGALCDPGEFCGSAGCSDCRPDCQGKCAGGDDGCGGQCPTTDCPDGCCDGSGLCVGLASQDDDTCGAAADVCRSCVEDARADRCVNGACICEADSARCAQGQFCSALGCSSCQPQCQGRCEGADDGCAGQCPTNDCLTGCCDVDDVCVPYGSQSDAECGTGGEECDDCSSLGRSCDGTLHVCLSSETDDAQFVDQSVPAVMTPGQTATVSVTMRNIGTATWTDAAGHRLGAQNPQDNSRWGLSRVNLDAADAVAPGETKTFTFQITAPATAGVHNFQWRMLRETVAWFGEYAYVVPVLVTSASVTVCEAVRSLAGTQTDASGPIQTCINNTPANGICELPAGVYRIDSQIQIGQAPIILRTEGKDPSMDKCALVNHDCAELMASTSFQDTGGILLVSQAGTVIDHIVINGNKTARASTFSGQQCGSGNNQYGHNMRIVASNCALMNSVTMNALCGTGCEVAGAGSGVVVYRSTVAYNGVHDQQGMWADGVTVHDYTDSTFSENEFVDNTDVDLIFGGCATCVIQYNVIWHGTAFANSSFAALMIHAWPSTSGNFNNADTSGNVIDCGSDRRCGFGLLLGSDAWYITDVFGGWVHHNVVQNAQQGVALDDVHDMTVYNNSVSNPAAFTNTSCGNRTTYAYTIGSRTHSVDTSRDTMSTNYTSADWDGCIPNWWN